MYKAIILVIVFCVALCACMAPGTQKPKETAAPVTAEPAAATPAATGEHRVFVVFSSENTDDFSTLILEDAGGERIPPVRSESTGEPVCGVFELAAGEYRFALGSGSTGKMTFVVDAAYDEVLVPAESPDDLFTVNTFSGTAVNPVYEGVISAGDIAPLERSIEERAASLREFYSNSMQNREEN